MATKLQRLQNIDETTKHAVSGSIRPYAKILALSESNLFHNLPLLIPSLCTLYVDSSDHFIANKDVKLLKNGTVIDGWRNDAEFGVCRGSAIIPSINECKARWILKITNVPDLYGTQMIIGVADINAVFNGHFDDLEGEFYVYSNTGWAKTGKIAGCNNPASYYSGVEIIVELDLLSVIPNVKFFKKWR